MTRIEFLETVWYESRRAGLETSLVLGLIQVESGFRKYAISSAGARGYMQVMPFWARLIGDGDASRLFHMQTNLRFGCVILRHYLDRERATCSWHWAATTAAAAAPNTRTWCLARGAQWDIRLRPADRVRRLQACHCLRCAPWVQAQQRQHTLHGVVHQRLRCWGRW
jgi:soluble lytic murein transglycosylase-like protein